MTRSVVFHEVGGPEVLRVENGDIREPDRGEIRIRVDVIGLNRGEALFRSGEYWLPPTLPSSRLGNEAAGIVDAIGEDVEGYSLGDKIGTMMISDMSVHGIYGDYAIVPASQAFRRPDDIDDVSSAATWLAYTTAYGALVETAQLKAGDTVVITAPAGAVGIAAIRVAKQLGAIPIAVTRRDDKHEQLLEVGAAHVITAESGNIVEEIHRRTEQRGADVIFDAVSGPGLTNLAQAVNPEGTVILTSNLDPASTPMPWVWPLHLHKYANPVFYSGDTQRMNRAHHFIAAGLRSGAFAPAIDSTFELGDIVEAHRRLESSDHFGKVIVAVEHK